MKNYLGMCICLGLITPLFTNAHAVEEHIGIDIKDAAVIEMTNEGFTPQEITVPLGTKVIWFNASKDREFWPASDLHPTHSAYPEKTDSDCIGSAFDACRGIAPDEYYEFIFSKPGSWVFHDHLNPELVGVIRVEDIQHKSVDFIHKLLPFLKKIYATSTNWFGKMLVQIGVKESINWTEATKSGFSKYKDKIENTELSDEYLRSQFDVCYGKGGQGQCYKKLADIIGSEFTLSQSMDALLRLEDNPEVFSQCHAVTHYLGRIGYDQEGSVPDAYTQCTEGCWGGCYHGVMEGYFADQGFLLDGSDDEKIKEALLKICGTRADYKEPGKYGECLHGLGHAMMFITTSDLPRSLAFCDASKDVNNRETCYSGVFMENSSSSTSLDHPSEYIDPENPLYPCTILDAKYLGTCYRYQSSYLAQLAHYDWNKTIELCLLVPDPYKDQCIQTVGSNQVGSTQDYKMMAATCNLVTDQSLRQSCVKGVVGSLGVRFLREPERMMKFCELVDIQSKNTCYSQAGTTVQSMAQDVERTKKACASIKDDFYKQVCLRASGNVQSEPQMFE